MVLALASLAPFEAVAQPVVSWLGLGSPEQETRALELFRKGLRDLGHEEERTLVLEERWARGDNARFPGLARELLAKRPAVVFSPCGPG